MTDVSAGGSLTKMGFWVLVMALALSIAGCTSHSEPVGSTSSTALPQTGSTSTSTASLVPGAQRGDKLPGLPLYALVDGNDVTADRINLVLAGWGWDDFDRFLDTSVRLLSWDGHPYLVDEEGWLFDGPAESAATANLGVFAIEPWRSNRHLFNVWYTDIEPDTPVAWLNQGEPPFRLSDQTIGILGMDTERFNSELGSVSGQDVVFYGPGEPVRPPDKRPFANFLVVMSSGDPAGGLTEFPHELAHAMFGFPDEYVGQLWGFDGREDPSSWPSCAEDLDEARAWWSDLEGQVDPMLDIWIDEMAAVGLDVGEREDLKRLVAVGYVDGGCYGVAGSVRATEDSLMNSSIPVMGAVNRRWAERVLALWGDPEGS